MLRQRLVFNQVDFLKEGCVVLDFEKEGDVEKGVCFESG